MRPHKLKVRAQLPWRSGVISVALQGDTNFTGRATKSCEGRQRSNAQWTANWKQAAHTETEVAKFLRAGEWTHDFSRSHSGGQAPQEGDTKNKKPMKTQ